MPPEDKRKLWEEQLDAALGVAASAILFALMLITFADVVSRYLFNWPLRGAFEATELMLLVLIFAGLPLVSHADEHVTMDFIDRMLTPRATAALVRVVHALCAAVMFFLAWQVWIKATRIAGYGDTTDVQRVHSAPAGHSADQLCERRNVSNRLLGSRRCELLNHVCGGIANGHTGTPDDLGKQRRNAGGQHGSGSRRPPHAPARHPRRSDRRPRRARWRCRAARSTVPAQRAGRPRR